MDEEIKIESPRLDPMILAYAAQDLSFFLKINAYMDTRKAKSKSYFSDFRYQYVFNILCRHYEELKRIPPLDNVLVRIEQDKGMRNDPNMKLFVENIAKKAYEQNLKEYDLEDLEKQTIDFIKQAKWYEALMLSQPDIKNRNLGAAMKRMEEVMKINFDKDLGTSILEVDKIFDKVRKIDKDLKLSVMGFSNLCNELGGGFHPKELYVFASTPGGGKTLTLGNLALSLFLGGKKVVVYTFETSMERLMMRYFCNLTDKKGTEINLDDEVTKNNLKEKFKEGENGNLVVKEYNAHEVCANDLRANIYDLTYYKDFKPDAIVVDYLTIMNSNDDSLDKTNSFTYYKTVAEELRNIAKTLNIPVLTACQINREGMGERGGTKAILTAKNVAESRGIHDTADVFITINQTPKDRKANKMILFFDKNRNQRNSVAINYTVNYDTMKMTEDGAAYSPIL
jgi:replicative DNA helicase